MSVALDSKSRMRFGRQMADGIPREIPSAVCAGRNDRRCYIEIAVFDASFANAGEESLYQV
jgi:hypothetical protein